MLFEVFLLLLVVGFWAVFGMMAFHDYQDDPTLKSRHGVYLGELALASILGAFLSPAGFVIGLTMGVLLAFIKVVHKADAFIFGVMGAGVGFLTGSPTMISAAGIVVVLALARAVRRTGTLPPVTPYAFISALVMGVVGVVL